jgi:phage N-6-adenine-methyltransferase
MNPKAYSNSGGNLWTPRWFIEQVEANHGPIHLDVCACKNSAVAQRYFTEQDNAFKQRWRARLAFCNPPGSDPLPWVQKIIAEQVTRLLLLVPAKTETAWFRLATQHARACELIFPRINYYDPVTKKLTNRINVGSALFLFTSTPHDHCYFSHREYRKPKGAVR